MDSTYKLTTSLVDRFLNKKWCVDHVLAPTSFDDINQKLTISISDEGLVNPVSEFLHKRLKNNVKSIVFNVSSKELIFSLLGVSESSEISNQEHSESTLKKESQEPELQDLGAGFIYNQQQTDIAAPKIHSCLFGDAAPPKDDPKSMDNLSRVIETAGFGSDIESYLQEDIESTSDQNCGAYSKPYGLTMGTKLKVLESLGLEPLTLPCKYQTTNVPKPHSEFENYIFTITPVNGLSWIKGIGQNIATPSTGLNLILKYEDILEKLCTKYGQPSKTDYLAEYSIWNEYNDFMMGILNGDRYLGAHWEQGKSKVDIYQDLESVYLGVAALDSNTGYLILEYTLANFKSGEQEINIMQDDAL